MEPVGSGACEYLFIGSRGAAAIFRCAPCLYRGVVLCFVGEAGRGNWALAEGGCGLIQSVVLRVLSRQRNRE